MASILPVEIFEIIAFYFGSITSFKLILGIKINKSQVFREGGLGIVLEKLLLDYPDRYTLTNLKRYLPNKEVPLIKAVLTKKMSVLIMVAEMWGSAYSNFAYVKAAQIGFVDALDFIDHNIPRPNPQLLNKFIIESQSVEAYNKVDLTVEEPFKLAVSDREYLNSFSRADPNEGRVSRMYAHKGKTERYLKGSHIMEIVRFYHEHGRIEKAIQWLNKLEEDDMFLDRNDFFKIVTGMRDYRILEGLNDKLGLSDLQLKIHKMFIEKNVEKIEELYLTYPRKVTYHGREHYLEVLQTIRMIWFFEDLEERREEEIEEKESSESNDINDWINEDDYPSYHLKEVRKFVESHNKENVNDIRKRLYLYHREDVIWFCNICMDLGYKAVKVDKLDCAYMEDKTIYYPALNLRLKPHLYTHFFTAEQPDDELHCFFDLSINYLNYFTSF